MKKIYKRVRGYVIVPSLETNIYLLHVLYLALLIIYPIAVEDLGFPQSFLTVLLAFFILFTMFLPDKINYLVLIVGTVAIVYLFFYMEQQYDVYSFYYFIKSVLLFLLAVSIFTAMVLEIIKSEISLRLLYLSIDCYLMLGLCFSFLLRSMHFIDPSSLNFPVSHEFNHIYMAFIVLTSTGLGDLLPTTLPTKAVVILNGLLGQIYLTFFAAVIVGKFLAKSMKSS